MMAVHNVVFAVDADYQPEELRFPRDWCLSYLKQWMLKVLLSLGSKYGFDNVRWGYKFFHSRTFKSASLITRSTDFKELQEKTFSDFEVEFVHKVGVNQISCEEHHRASPAICVQNTLKEILLDFQWDRPDITSPTKLSLRPRRSTRNTTNNPMADDDISCHGKNVVFLVSECPYSRNDMVEFLQLPNSNIGSQWDLHELILPKGLIDMLNYRKVVLHWADCSSREVNHEADDYTSLKTVMDALQPVAGKVIPLFMSGMKLKHKDPNPCTRDNKGVLSFPTGSSTGYILSSEKTYKRTFPSLVGTLCWGAEKNKQTCSVSLEPVACRQRCLNTPVQVTLRSVLRGLNTCRLKQTASECWILICQQKSEQNQVTFQSLFKDLFTIDSDMLAEVSEGGQVHSAVLSVLSYNMALLTVLHSEEPLCACLPSETADLPDTSDLHDIVSSVFKDLMKDKDTSDQPGPHQIPEWATQELQQGTNLTTELTEGWFPLSDQSGISCHLMESMRLLHAAPEEQEHTEDDTHEQELTNSLAELYKNNKDGHSGVSKGKKRGTQRTPVRQKMKTMSRSLQMLNVARFNVKAQKNQTETESSVTTKGTEKRGKRCSSERTRPGPMYFKNKDELLSHLTLGYQQAVEDKSVGLITYVQDLLSVLETFIKIHFDTEDSFLNIIKKNLLKSVQSIRHIYGNTADSESKIRDCQLQVVLRLELCKLLTSEDQDHVEQMVEEVAGMLRVISLTKDPVYLSKFMQEEVLPLYLTGIPKVLADIYHSLGTQLPEVLVAVLPADFFSDDSVAKESVCVSPSPLSATQSLVSSVGDRLEELRNRSAKKRRTSMLTRHKSTTEAPLNLRQIEMPRKSTRQAKTKECVPPEKPNVGGPSTQKQTVQEVTKVRRNLFNQEAMSSKKAKMTRSQSVSAVDVMKKRKRSQVEDGRHTLLTKKVSETPLHKQVSNRLLYRQRNSRSSGDTDLVVVEESPVKPVTDLRRSPRIKKLARRHSSVFYSSSQPRSRNLDRALSSSQLPVSESKGDINIKGVKSPMRLLFGAAESPARTSTSRSTRKDAEVARLGSTDSVFENCNKTPRKSPYKQPGPATERRTPRKPGSSSKTEMCFFPKSPDCGENCMVLRGSPFRSPASKSLVLESPKKSPLKSILKTPVKSFMECGSPSGPSVRSPNMRTPRKSVTWSPSPWKGLPEQPFKVPDSPVFSIRYSPRLITPNKRCRDQGDVFKTPEKSSQQKGNVSPKTPQRGSGFTPNVVVEEPQLSRRSEKFSRTLSLPEKADPRSPNILLYDHPSPPTPGIKTPSKSPGPTHTMCTRSGRTPLKCSSTRSPDKETDISSFNKERSLEPTPTSPSPGSHTPVVTNHRATLSRETKPNQALHCESWTTKLTDGQNESIRALEEASSSDTQQFDSSQFSATSTEESIDIAEAAVVKTELTGGIKMNISFSRKPSKLSEVFGFTGSPAVPAKSTNGCSRYGFRQTPDRQQRKAAARLGYSPGLQMFSSPQASGTPVHRKQQPVEPNPLTYQVELEMQASGLPKLKFKRTDSFNSVESSGNAAKGQVPHVNNKPSRVNSPLTHCSKHREPSCISPSHCTPGKGGVQKYICQSITPTRLLTNSPSPLGHGEHVPWTPSPQSRGRATPENFNTWPRKKRARIGLSGTKEIKEGTEILEDPELDGVFRLPGTEEPKELKDASAFKYTLAIPSKLCSSEEMDWAESVVRNCDKTDTMTRDEFSWISGSGSCSSAVTPPHPKVKKAVSASGILALTQSPLLYKGKRSSVTKETTQRDGSSGNSEQFDSMDSMNTFNVSPVSQPRRRQACGRTYSRKRLLDP